MRMKRIVLMGHSLGAIIIKAVSLKSKPSLINSEK
jgi:predicted alpha/beta superfamily hydrolase